MNKIFLSLVVSGALLGGLANSSDLEIENRVLKDKIYNLENKSNKQIDIRELKSNIKIQRQLGDYNTDKSVMDKIVGKFKVTYSIFGSSFNQYLNIYNPEIDSTYGYINYGEYRYSNSFLNNYNLRCAYDNSESLGYDYICTGVSTLGSNYSSWYYFNISGNYIDGRYYIGNSTEAAQARMYGSDYIMTGYKMETTFISTSDTTSSNTSPTTTDDTIASNTSSTTTSDTTSSTESLTPPSVPENTTSDVQTYTLTKTDIDNLSSGWHLLGTGSKITDTTIFSSAKNVWVYDNQSWEQKPAEIEALKGFWIYK